MKYLKGYEIFESLESKINLVNDIKEVFYDISDKLYVDIGYFDLYGKHSDKISVFIKNYKGRDKSLLKFDSIKDELEFAINYITREMGLEIFNIKAVRDNGSSINDDKFVSSKHDNFNNLLNDNKSMYPIVSLNIIFKTK